MKKLVITSVAAIALASSAFAGVNAAAKSKVVAEMTHAEIATALKGYKAGTYGGPMKGVMKGQVAKYSDADLEAFAQTIGK